MGIDKVIRVGRDIMESLYHVAEDTGMGKRRSMIRKKKYDERNTIKPWSDLHEDVLLLVMMKLHAAEFVAFSRVCKAWRSLAICNKKKFLGSREPMAVSLTINDKDCNLVGRTCIGVTCGYLILFGKKTSDFWLSNPVTNHDLHFPCIPNDLFMCPRNHRAILVFSPSISAYVFILFNRCFNDKIWFSIAGTREWPYVYTGRYPIRDLIAFKGKIYTAHSVLWSDNVSLYEIKLHPHLELVFLQTQPNLALPGFVTSGENLYLIDITLSQHPYNIHEIDLDKMKWVSCENQGKEFSFFLYDFKLCHDHLHHGRFVFTGENGKGKGWSSLEASMWYFFFDCLDVDVIHE